MITDDCLTTAWIEVAIEDWFNRLKKLDGAGVAFFITSLVLVRVGRNLFYPSLEKRKMLIFRATSALVDTQITSPLQATSIPKYLKLFLGRL